MMPRMFDLVHGKRKLMETSRARAASIRRRVLVS
jgi:hypothetical protein